MCYNGNCVDQDSIRRFEDDTNVEKFHNEHIDVSDILGGGHYDTSENLGENVKSGENVKTPGTSNSNEVMSEEYGSHGDKASLRQGDSLEERKEKSKPEIKLKESSVEHSARLRMPHPGDRRNLPHREKTKSGGSRKHGIPTEDPFVEKETGEFLESF